MTVNNKMPEYLIPMKEIVQSFRPEIKGTDEFSQFVLQNFQFIETNCLEKQPLDILQSAEVIILGEDHDEMSMEMKNSCVVNFLWQDTFPLLTETRLGNVQQVRFFDKTILNNRLCWDSEESTVEMAEIGNRIYWSVMMARDLTGLLATYEEYPDEFFDSSITEEVSDMINSIREEIQGVLDDHARLVNTTFHERNERFVNSILSQLSSGAQKVFVIAGSAHLTHSVDRDGFSASVDFIYDALNSSGHSYVTMMPTKEGSASDSDSADQEVSCIGRAGVERQKKEAESKWTSPKDLPLLRIISNIGIEKFHTGEREQTGEFLMQIMLNYQDYFDIWNGIIKNHSS